MPNSSHVQHLSAAARLSPGILESWLVKILEQLPKLGVANLPPWRSTRDTQFPLKESGDGQGWCCQEQRHFWNCATIATTYCNLLVCNLPVCNLPGAAMTLQMVWGPVSTSSGLLILQNGSKMTSGPTSGFVTKTRSGFQSQFGAILQRGVV